MIETSRVLYTEAARILKSEPNIRQALEFLRANPDSLDDRVRTYNSVCKQLNSFFRKPWFNNHDRYSFHTNSVSLNQDFEIHKVHTLDGITRIATRSGRQTLVDILSKTSSGEWDFPRSVKEPGKLASALMIEGGGLLLEKTRHKPGLGRRFVLAFEEMLLRNEMGSRMLIDVLPWMIEEREEFPYRLRDYLAKIKSLPLTLDDQLKALPDISQRQQETQRLHQEVLELLKPAGIAILHSEFRCNDDNRIREKALYMGSRPMVDIFGVRIVIAEADREKTAYLIHGHWETPEVFPWGGGIRRDFKVRKPHSFSQDDYQATHLNFMFNNQFICEVQVVNPDQYRTNIAGEPMFRVREQERIAQLRAKLQG